MPSLENVDIPTLRNAIQQTHEIAGLVKPVVLDFNKYAHRITNQKKIEALKQEMPLFNVALDDVLRNGRTCLALDMALDYIVKQQGPAAVLTEIEKKWALNRLVDIHLSLFETMQIIVRAVPKRHKLHGQARKVLSQMSAQTLLGGVN